MLEQMAGYDAGMIVGIGTDIVEVDRIRDSQKFGEKFIDRILLPAEREYCLSHTDPAPKIAARFAAKEAIAKAFGTGIGDSLCWHDMEITRENSGKPLAQLHGQAKGAPRENRHQPSPHHPEPHLPTRHRHRRVGALN